MPDALRGLPAAALLARADDLLPAYRAAIAGMPRETERKGICASEMFFFYAFVAPLAPRLILESGRARAESTLTLARCFPAARVVSVELLRNHPDVPLAEAKLRPHPHVEPLYGDSRVLLPPRLEPGCVVLVDGPKGFRALKLALRLLATGRPAAVFLHDFGAGFPERRFVEKHFPDARCSDDPGFLARYADLDADAGDPLAGQPRWSAFACLPGGPQPAPLPVLLARVNLARARALAPRKLGRLWPGRRQRPGSGPG